MVRYLDVSELITKIIVLQGPDRSQIQFKILKIERWYLFMFPNYVYRPMTPKIITKKQTIIVRVNIQSTIYFLVKRRKLKVIPMGLGGQGGGLICLNTIN